MMRMCLIVEWYRTWVSKFIQLYICEKLLLCQHPFSSSYPCTIYTIVDSVITENMMQFGYLRKCRCFFSSGFRYRDPNHEAASRCRCHAGSTLLHHLDAPDAHQMLRNRGSSRSLTCSFSRAMTEYACLTDPIWLHRFGSPTASWMLKVATISRWRSAFLNLFCYFWNATNFPDFTGCCFLWLCYGYIRASHENLEASPWSTAGIIAANVESFKEGKKRWSGI